MLLSSVVVINYVLFVLHLSLQYRCWEALVLYSILHCHRRTAHKRKLPKFNHVSFLYFIKTSKIKLFNIVYDSLSLT